jgi:serine O-acetyltransferase
MTPHRDETPLAPAPACAGPRAETGAGPGVSCVRCTGPAELLLESYRRVGNINHLEGKNLPSKRAVAGIARDLVRLLFPGFFEERLPHADEVEGEVSLLMHAVCHRLREEIAKSLRCSPSCPAVADLPAIANEVTAEFLREIPEVREILQTDVEAAYQGDPAAFAVDEVILAYPFVEAVAVQRLAHRLYRKGVPLVPRIMTEWAHGRTGIDIHPGAEIGSHFYIDHGTGTVIGETTRIGDHVKLYQSVGLVARSLSGGRALFGRKRHPTLEDRVTVYAGATIMGGDTVVGAGSTIGASVFLGRSVPANSIVINEEARIVVLPKGAGIPGDFQI